MSTETNEELARFSELKTKIKTISDIKIRLDERLKTEKEKLDKFLKDITAKGYDPTKLAEIRAQKQAELTQALDILEKEINATLAKLAEIEASTNG